LPSICHILGLIPALQNKKLLAKSINSIKDYAFDITDELSKNIKSE
jgi:hypothetical protein